MSSNYEMSVDYYNPNLHTENSPLISKKIRATQSFFEENSWLENIFAFDSHGRTIRSSICIWWGFCSIAFCFGILKYMYGYSNSRGFFVATTTITTIGYGPIYDPYNHDDHNFLSIYFIFMVLPFVFLQLVCTMDDIGVNASYLNDRIVSRCRKGSTPAQAFHYELRMTLLSAAALLLVLLIIGTVCYCFLADQQTWGEGVFYAITSATTIGYGQFDVENDWGYYAIGVYALACNYTVGLVFSKVAAFGAAAGKNIRMVRDQIREDIISQSRDRENDSAIL